MSEDILTAILGLVILAVIILSLIMVRLNDKWAQECLKRGMLKYQEPDGQLVWRDTGKPAP